MIFFDKVNVESYCCVEFVAWNQLQVPFWHIFPSTHLVWMPLIAVEMVSSRLGGMGQTVMRQTF